jgi:5-methylcytosine-specific restriction endonuclease McrA
LGIDDNAISFFLSCAFEQFLEDHAFYKQLVVDAKFKGDDQIITVEGDEEDIYNFFRKWVSYLDKLGFLINAKKSMIASVGQFCELVGKSYLEKLRTVKDLSFCLTFYDAHGCYNIVDAKQYIAALKLASDNIRNLSSQLVNYCMVSTISGLPIEFVEEEKWHPFELGGYHYDFKYGLNEFILNYLVTKERTYDGQKEWHLPVTDRRLYNLVGSERPYQPYERRRIKNLVHSVIEDTRLHERLLKISAEPMSKAWRKEFDRCATLRQKLFYNPIRRTKGSIIQTLYDERLKYAIPLRDLELNDREHLHRLKKKFKKNRFAQLKKGRPKKLVEKTKKSIYLIDKVRAQALLKFYETGQDEFGLHYYKTIRPCVFMWSLCKYVARSQWAVPIYWLDWAMKNNISVDRLLKYYWHKYQVDFYNFKPYREVPPAVSKIFRGDPEGDMVIFCPFTGYPIKYNILEMGVRLYDLKEKLNKIFADLVRKYYPRFDDEYLIYIGEFAYENLDWLDFSTIPIVWPDPVYDAEQYKREPTPLDHMQDIRELCLPIYEPVEDNNTGQIDVERKETDSESFSEVHESSSDSDPYLDYLKKNPLDEEDEENPLGDYESSSEG